MYIIGQEEHPHVHVEYIQMFYMALALQAE